MPKNHQIQAKTLPLLRLDGSVVKRVALRGLQAFRRADARRLRKKRQKAGGERNVTPKELVSAIAKLAKREDADLYVYSADIRGGYVDQFRAIICNKVQRRKNVILFLTTMGGDPDAAYRLAACLKRHYQKVAVYIFGDCKSAGTLAALGANNLVFGNFGELGPLDVQLAKQDEILPMSSGLDIFQALAVVTNSAYDAFEKMFLQIVSSSGGGLTAKTSAEISRELAVGLFAPLTAQIDPERLGEVQRAINIASTYGARLDNGNLKKNALEKLVQGYPSHSFVIDFEEAVKLFVKVRSADKLEAAVGAALPGARRPGSQPLIIDVEKYIVLPSKKGSSHATPTKSKQKTAPAPAAGGSNPAQQPGGNVAQLRRDAAGHGAVADRHGHAANDRARAPKKARKTRV